MKPEDFELADTPLKAGDLVVVECYGKLIPRADGSGPQLFVAPLNQIPGQAIDIKPFHGAATAHKAKRFVVQGMRF